MLWDIGGQERFAHLRQIYFKGSHASLGVFDVNNKQTLIKIPGWVSSIKKSVKRGIPMILIGNKIDLDRKVEREEAERLAKKLGCEYIETSAKTGANIERVFEKIARLCLESIAVD